MGIMKHKMEDDANLRAIALDILKEAKAAEICKAHWKGYLVDESLIENAYKLGNYKISRGMLFCERKELSDAIRDVSKAMPTMCPDCENVMYGDD
jgi:hypothetical protein